MYNRTTVSKVHPEQEISQKLQKHGIHEMNQREFDDAFGFQVKPKASFKNRLSNALPDFRKFASFQGLIRFIEKRVPVVNWIRRYKLKYFRCDFCAGAVLASYNVPQSLAYAALAGLSLTSGLYVSIISPMIYFVFGSSRHVSIGVFSLISLMISKLAAKYIGQNGVDEAVFISSLSFTTGSILWILGLLQCDRIMILFPDVAVDGLILGAAIQGVVNQLFSALGLATPADEGEFFKTIKDLIYVASNVEKIHLPTLALFLFATFILVSGKKLSSAFKILIPVEVITVATMTLLSHFLNFADNWGVKIIGAIPLPVPDLRFPNMSLCWQLVGNAAALAIVSYVITLALAKKFGRQYRYAIDSHQEIYALGIANFACSIVGAFPPSGSLSRTTINVSANAKTQISGLFASLILLVFVVLLRFILTPCPKCTLAAIVIVALASLIVKVKDGIKLYKCARPDFVIYLLTLLTTILWDIMPAVAVGSASAAIIALYKTLRPKVRRLVEITPGQYRAEGSYKNFTVLPAPLVRTDSLILYTNCDSFRDEVRETVKELFLNREIESSLESYEKADAWTAVVFDCGSWFYTDNQSMAMLEELNDEMLNRRVLLMFAHLQSSVRQQYAAFGLFDKLSEKQFYPSVANAMENAKLLSANDREFFEDEPTFQPYLISNNGSIDTPL